KRKSSERKQDNWASMCVIGEYFEKLCSRHVASTTLAIRGRSGNLLNGSKTTGRAMCVIGEYFEKLCSRHVASKTMAIRGRSGNLLNGSKTTGRAMCVTGEYCARQNWNECEKHANEKL
ncbi:hypothetical protein J6590_035847, partial [Homalodisca vitripennis]